MLAKALLEPGTGEARVARMQKLLESQRTLKGRSLLDLASRHAGRLRT